MSRNSNMQAFDKAEEFIRKYRPGVDNSQSYAAFLESQVRSASWNPPPYDHPDPFGAENMFVKNFINTEMEDEFPSIARDFLVHEFSGIPDFLTVYYGNDEPCYGGAVKFLHQKMLNLILCAAKKGRPYSIELLRYLYKTYYHSEYNQFKRFSSFHLLDITALADGKLDEFGLDDSVDVMNRVLILAPYFDKDIEADALVLYDLLGRFDDDEERRMDDERTHSVPRKIVDEATAQVEDWLSGLEPEARFTDMIEAEEFLDAAFRSRGYGDSGAVLDEVESGYYISFKERMIRTLTLLKDAHPKQEYSYHDVQLMAALYYCAAGITDSLNAVDTYINDLIGARFDYVDYEPRNPRFNPEKIHPARTAAPKPAPQVSIPNSAPTDTEELEDLRSKLHRAEQENRRLRSLYEESRKANADYCNALKQNDADQKELYALREHVYRMTEEDNMSADEPDISLSIMEEGIAGKQILIIGGHDNWTNKLKARFPNWRFISTEVSAIADEKVLAGCDYIYFFTEHLSHRTYGSYVKMIRKLNLSFGYIHSVNIDNNIRQIYEDTSSIALARN